MHIHDYEIRTYEDEKTGKRYEIKFLDDGQCGPTYDISNAPESYQLECCLSVLTDYRSNRVDPNISWYEADEDDPEHIYIWTAYGENKFIYSPSDRLKHFQQYFYPMIGRMYELDKLTRPQVIDMAKDFYSRFILDISDASADEIIEVAGNAEVVFSKTSISNTDTLIFYHCDENGGGSFLVVRNPSDKIRVFTKLLSTSTMIEEEFKRDC